MSRSEFVKGNLESLLGDSDVKDVLDRAKSVEEKRDMTNRLRSTLGRSYDTYADNYFKNKGLLKSGASLALRVGGLGADLVGDYGILTMGTGFLIKRYIAAPMKVAAGAIDAQHYVSYAETDSGVEKATRVGSGVAEEFAEKAVSAFIPGMGIVDFARGTIWNKYNTKVNSYAKSKAKDMFLEEVDSEPYILKLKDHFMHPDYKNGKVEKKNEESLANAA